MVYLNRIYTRSGDTGTTALGTGERVPKTHARIVAFGAVDELNSTLGLALALPDLAEAQVAQLQGIQNDLFDVGADLCVPESPTAPETGDLRVTGAQVEHLEQAIDAATAQLEPLTSFILPGGSPLAAALHLARAVCRRAEVEVWRLIAAETVNPQVPTYLNRLSDLLFVLARLANDQGRQDILWRPGGEPRP